MTELNYTKTTDLFYAEIFEFIIGRKELLDKMSMYEKLFDYPGLTPLEQKSICLDWFIFDYREPESSTSVLDMFISEPIPDPEKKAIYAGFKNCIYGLFEIKAVKAGKEAVLSDLSTGLEHKVFDTTMTRNVKKGEVCILRILPYKDAKIVTGRAYVLNRETAVFLKINREFMQKAKGGITPIDVMKLFYESDSSSKMPPKDRLIYLAGKANLKEDDIQPMMENMAKEAAAKGDSVKFMTDIIAKAGRLGERDKADLVSAVMNYWNSLIERNSDYVAKGPVEDALMNMAFIRCEEIYKKMRVKNTKKAQAELDAWLKEPLFVLDGKTPEQAIVEERKSLKNPEMRVHYSFDMHEIKDPEDEEKEKKAEKLFYSAADLMREEDYKGALGLFGKYNMLWDGNRIVHFNMGVCYFHLENYEAAEICLEKALKIEPNYEKARAALNDLKKRKQKQAMKKTQKAQVKTKPCRILRFYISLDYVEPKIWRKVEVGDDMGLRAFAVALLLAMGWKNSHLHEFVIEGKHYGMTGDDLGYMEGVEPEEETKYKLRDFTGKQLEKTRFLYDFGDGWEHNLIFECVVEREAGAFYPRCTAGARNCPPEDCGGTGGYEDLLEKLKKPGNEEYEGLIDWLGGKYDAEFFDLELVNHEVAKTEAYERYGFEGDKSAGNIVMENGYKNCGIGTSEDLEALKTVKKRKKQGNKN